MVEAGRTFAEMVAMHPKYQAQAKHSERHEDFQNAPGDEHYCTVDRVSEGDWRGRESEEENYS